MAMLGIKAYILTLYPFLMCSIIFFCQMQVIQHNIKNVLRGQRETAIHFICMYSVHSYRYVFVDMLWIFFPGGNPSLKLNWLQYNHRKDWAGIHSIGPDINMREAGDKTKPLYTSL